MRRDRSWSRIWRARWGPTRRSVRSFQMLTGFPVAARAASSSAMARGHTSRCAAVLSDGGGVGADRGVGGGLAGVWARCGWGGRRRSACRCQGVAGSAVCGRISGRIGDGHDRFGAAGGGSGGNGSGWGGSLGGIGGADPVQQIGDGASVGGDRLRQSDQQQGRGQVQQHGCRIGTPGPPDLPAGPQTLPGVHQRGGASCAPAQRGRPGRRGDAPGGQARVDVQNAGEGGADPWGRGGWRWARGRLGWWRSG